MRFFSALLTVLCALSVAAHISSTYTIHHRLYHPTLPHLPYTERGTVHISNDDSVSFHPSSSLLEDFISSTSQLDGSPDNLYYQLALQRGDEEQSLWDFTSVKAVCNSQLCSPGVLLTSLSHSAVPSVPGDITNHHPSYQKRQTLRRGLFRISHST